MARLSERFVPLTAPRMTLGNVYDMDLKKNETLIKEVIIQAQGEVGSSKCDACVTGTDPFVQMALEEYIKTVKETWSSYTLDLVNYQNKCRLIKCVVTVIHVIYRKFTFS